LADIFGRRSVYFLSLVFFTISSVVCATAPNVAAILAGRTIQCMGARGITATNLIIISDIMPLRQRAKYIGMLQLMLALSTNTAPIIGGALIKTSCRWLFWINLPFCGIGLAIVPLFLQYKRPATTICDKLSSVD
jgi:MFS family permease